MKIHLASGSPRRAKILSAAGVEFDVLKTDAPEVSFPDDPARTVTVNALAKGRAAAALPEGTKGILSADTIVWYSGRIYGKPRDLEEAKKFLRELSGRVHTVYTAVALDGAAEVETSDVEFRELSDEEIDSYVAEVRPTDRAGAYDIDESGFRLVARFTGEYENIMGLPLAPLRRRGVLAAEYDIIPGK